MIRYLQFPFHTAGLLLVATFTLGLTIAVDAGLMGIAAGLLFISWFFKYCFVLLDAVIAGAEEPPVLDVNMVNPLSEQRPLAQALIIAGGVLLTLWVWQHAGVRWAYLCGGLLTLTLPASVAVMAISGNAFVAMWPPALVRLIHGLRWHYLMPVAMMAVAALSVRWMSVRDVSLWLIIAVVQVLFLLTFSLIGGVVHENRFELGIDTLTREEREKARAEAEHQRARAQMLDRAYAKFNVSESRLGWEEIQKWLAAYSEDTLFMEHRAVLKAVSVWPDVRPADKLAGDLIAALLARKRTGEALEVVEGRLASNPGFRPAEEAHTVRLAELAGLAGKRGLRRVLESKPST
jgi:hypothetical protein